jgi:hypothetical protein
VTAARDHDWEDKMTDDDYREFARLSRVAGKALLRMAELFARRGMREGSSPIQRSMLLRLSSTPRSLRSIASSPIRPRGCTRPIEHYFSSAPNTLPVLRLTLWTCLQAKQISPSYTFAAILGRALHPRGAVG